MKVTLSKSKKFEKADICPLRHVHYWTCVGGSSHKITPEHVAADLAETEKDEREGAVRAQPEEDEEPMSEDALEDTSKPDDHTGMFGLINLRHVHS